MASQNLDTRFPQHLRVLLFLYFVVSAITLIITIGTLIEQVRVYHYDCYWNSPCQPFDIAVPAIGMTVSAIAFLQAIAQIYFHNEHRLSPLGLFMSNALLTILWVVVIGLGWATPSEHFDFNPDGYSGYVSDIQGWERVYADAYKLVNEEEYYLNMLGNYGIDAVLGFAMGFIVMTILSFVFTTLMAFYALVIIQNNHQPGESPHRVQVMQESGVAKVNQMDGQSGH